MLKTNNTASRRFNELDPENLHRCSMGHYKKSEGGGFYIFHFIFDLEGSEYMALSPKDLGLSLIHI